MAKATVCSFCNGPHTPKECSMLVSVKDRLKKLKEPKARFRFAQIGHRMATQVYKRTPHSSVVQDRWCQKA